ncbi:MAG: hypothetical protein AB7V44_20385 [Pseudonocardia sp.]
MKVAIAQLAGDGGPNADRVFVTDQAVIVLDGASAFEPVDLDPGDYAQALGEAIAAQLDHEPAIPLTDAVATAIRVVTERLDLTPGRSPSSTVAILRVRDHAADLYVLGDSPIHYGTDTTAHELLDNRMATVGTIQRQAYTATLRAGHGFDHQHRQTLAELQRVERQHRNREPGYWIAETDPAAAHHALTATLKPDAITWAVLATDGASDPLQHLGHRWPDIAHHDSTQLAGLLAQVDRWEQDADPDARQLPRSKRHDDKTIAVVDTCKQPAALPNPYVGDHGAACGGARPAAPAPLGSRLYLRPGAAGGTG